MNRVVEKQFRNDLTSFQSFFTYLFVHLGDRNPRLHYTHILSSFFQQFFITLLSLSLGSTPQSLGLMRSLLTHSVSTGSIFSLSSAKLTNFSPILHRRVFSLVPFYCPNLKERVCS